MRNAKKTVLASVVLLICAPGFLSSQTAAKQTQAAVTPASHLVARHYTEGEKLACIMKGNNEGWEYEAQAHGWVKKDSAGHMLEEYGLVGLQNQILRRSVPLPHPETH